jgi:predicted transcriptional regulator
MISTRARRGTTTQVSARVTNEVAEFLQNIAGKNSRSLSWVVAYALKEWKASKEPKATP